MGSIPDSVDPASLDLEGKVAIVTGAGRERGIGWEAAIALASSGASVAVTDIARRKPETDWHGRVSVAEDMTALNALASRIEAMGVRCWPMALDVTSRNEVERCVAEVSKAFGGVDILFNNAGTPVGIAPLLETSDEVWDVSWRTNVMGMVYASRAVVPEMKRRNGGSIINNSSVAGLRATFESAAYTTTKFAVVGLTKSLAIDFGHWGIRCNAVCPGDISTKMNDLTSQVIAERSARRPELSARSESKLPALGRQGLPEDVGRVVAWLASDSAGFVTGETIRVDGGWELGL